MSSRYIVLVSDIIHYYYLQRLGFHLKKIGLLVEAGCYRGSAKNVSVAIFYIGCHTVGFFLYTLALMELSKFVKSNLAWPILT